MNQMNSGGFPVPSSGRAQRKEHQFYEFPGDSSCQRLARLAGTLACVLAPALVFHYHPLGIHGNKAEGTQSWGKDGKIFNKYDFFFFFNQIQY